ncbi:two-component sensor histidine kinase [Microbacterium murale]|uniref:histidine kinase n=1 Tax=Microbacterium murale TaxID=1081040 RepID=A0ABQ1S0J7_9MICO|nr:sensor histidine kinase [Microbacterium murale]GGD87017.1 two-component sensor histidine kinase [Microbacterium murale]
MVIRPLSRTSLILDIVGAFVLFAVLVPTSLAFYAPGNLSTTVPEAVGIAGLVVAGVLQFGAVAIGRLAPGIALAAAWVGAIVQMAVGLGPLPINVAILGVLYATAAWGTTRVFWAGLVSSFAGGIIASAYIAFSTGQFFAAGISSTVATFVLLAFMCILALGSPWLGGFGWRMVLRWRASREAQTLAEIATAEEQERVRIARDMHDVVAHSLAVIVAQSDGARYAAASSPEVAVEALGTISQTARSALSDVRMLLTQLRHRQGDGPQPTIADLEQLFAHVRQAGVEPRVTVDPMPPGEPPGAIQLAVYRILQEALTNAIRHGAGGVVDIRLAWLTDRVEVEVRNAIAVAPVVGASGGHGLVGMRERAQLVGGSLTAERTGDEFVVHATLPIGASQSSEGHE